MNHIARPDSIYKKNNYADEFKFKINSEVTIKDHNFNQDENSEYIKLSENLAPDFQISLLGLHYTDFFATCDENLARLLKYLFPNYQDKIQ